MLNNKNHDTVGAASNSSPTVREQSRADASATWISGSVNTSYPLYACGKESVGSRLSVTKWDYEQHTFVTFFN